MSSTFPNLSGQRIDVIVAPYVMTCTLIPFSFVKVNLLTVSAAFDIGFVVDPNVSSVIEIDISLEQNCLNRFDERKMFQKNIGKHHPKTENRLLFTSFWNTRNNEQTCRQIPNNYIVRILIKSVERTNLFDVG